MGLRVARELPRNGFGVEMNILAQQHKDQIDADHRTTPKLDKIDRGLEHQNRNPVKVLTSGKERRVKVPFEASGKMRYEKRVRWWEEYEADDPLCVFGHYSQFRDESVSPARAICADFAVAKRWQERKEPSFNGTFRGCLGALRLPENTLHFDDGTQQEFGADR